MALGLPKLSLTGGNSGPATASGSGGESNIGGIGAVTIGGFKTNGDATVIPKWKIVLAVVAVAAGVVWFYKRAK